MLEILVWFMLCCYQPLACLIERAGGPMRYWILCVNSRLDQGLTEIYSCPTCRKPLFAGRSRDDANLRTGEVSSDEQLARQISSGLDLAGPAAHALPAGVFPNQTHDALESSVWRFSFLCFLTWLLLTLFKDNCFWPLIPKQRKEKSSFTTCFVIILMLYTVIVWHQFHVSIGYLEMCSLLLLEESVACLE